MFTFAILEALVNGDSNQNGTIEVSEIAVWVQTKTPVLSKALREKRRVRVAIDYAAQGYAERNFGKRPTRRLPDQISPRNPRTGSRGENFSLVKKLAALPQSLPQRVAHRTSRRISSKR